MGLAWTYNIFDPQDPDEAFKTQYANVRLDARSDYYFELTLHKLELSDGIFSPFKSLE